MDAKKMWEDLNKIPIIGDIIISFAIVFTLTTLSSAGNFWGLEGENKKLLIDSFIALGVTYFIYTIIKKMYLFLIKR